jgi:hypothetical protein
MASFETDTSTQQSNIISASSGFTTKIKPNLMPSSSSGLYYPSVDNVRIYTNSNDALIIDSNGILYGNGAGLSNLTASYIPNYFASNNIQFYPLISVMNASILTNSNNFQYYPLTSVRLMGNIDQNMLAA